MHSRDPSTGDHGFLHAREVFLMFYATIWSLLPPVVAIALALITKEVYSSLFLGIVVGASPGSRR